MASRGAQPGNKNAEAKPWAAAIRAALEKRGTAKLDALTAIAEKLLQKAGEGDTRALKELGDRLDGKPHQTIAAEVDSTVTVEVVRFGPGKAAK